MPIPYPILPMPSRRFTPSRKFVTLTKSQKPFKAEDVELLFEQLDPVTPETLVQGGEWHGIILNTGHPFVEQLSELHWRGSIFHSTENVEPLVVERDANSEKSVGVTDFGGACLRRMVYRGLVSAAVVFDDLPAITYLRAVSDRMVAGVMESKSFGEAGKFYFYLVR